MCVHKTVYRRLKRNSTDGQTGLSQDNAYDTDQSNSFTVENVSDYKSRRTAHKGSLKVSKVINHHGSREPETKLLLF
jgi:hypothetical protein